MSKELSFFKKIYTFTQCLDIFLTPSVQPKKYCTDWIEQTGQNPITLLVY